MSPLSWTEPDRFENTMTDTTIFPARTIVTMDPSQPTVEAVAVRTAAPLPA